MKTKVNITYYMRIPSGKLVVVDKREEIVSSDLELISISDETCAFFKKKYDNDIIRVFEKYTNIEEEVNIVQENDAPNLTYETFDSILDENKIEQSEIETDTQIKTNKKRQQKQL